ncbi:MAG: AAA family ATPase [Thermoplasmata archaeon]|nr:AAA family ATPase [Thermoplasmata archaeon]
MISLKAVRRAGVPLVAIETSDMQQTILNITNEMNGKAKETPMLRWDVCRGLEGLNDEGKKFSNGYDAQATQNPKDCLLILADNKLPERAIIFFENAHLYWKMEEVLQATWNLRDILKGIGATLVMLCASVQLPAELKNDIITLTDTLPDDAEVTIIVDSILKDAKIKKVEDKEKIHDTLLGLSAFAAEQVLAMSIQKQDGETNIDRVGLWERKRKMIEQTPGLSVWRGGETFKDIGGYENVKSFMQSICKGNSAPRSIVFIDEIEKSMAGSQSDSSGVSQDYLRCLLTWMQDKKAAGIVFIGISGSGKSAIAKATGNEANIPTIAFDMGGMKNKFVGDSEGAIRTALQVVDAVSQGKCLFVTTCNSIGSLPPELRRRFSLGTFFFDIPDDKAKTKIWNIHLKKYGVTEKQKASFPNDAGWTGAEIENCCNISYRLNCTLTQAAKFIVPVTVSGKDRILQMSKDASGKYIDASKEGIYIYQEKQNQANQSRKFEE